jgi:hypothetical protein
MFETLTQGFRTAKQKFQGLAELNESTVDAALVDVRTSLLEADVGFEVVQDFCKRVREKALGVIVKVRASSNEKVRRVTPEDHFVKLCHDELVELMGPVDSSIRFAKKGPTGIMVVGPAGKRQDHHRRQAGALCWKSAAAGPCWLPPTCIARPPSTNSVSWASSCTCRSSPSPEAARRSSAKRPSATPPNRDATRFSSTPLAGSPSTSP